MRSSSSQPLSKQRSSKLSHAASADTSPEPQPSTAKKCKNIADLDESLILRIVESTLEYFLSEDDTDFTANFEQYRQYAKSLLHFSNVSYTENDVDLITNEVVKKLNAEQALDKGRLTGQVLNVLSDSISKLPRLCQSRKKLSYSDLCILRTFLLTFSNVVYLQGLKVANLISDIPDLERFRSYSDSFEYKIDFEKLPPDEFELQKMFDDEFDVQTAWYCAVLCLYRFQHRLRKESELSEIQYQSEFWNELIVLSIGTWFNPFQSEMEFQLTSKTITSYPAEHYIDIAVLLTLEMAPKVAFPVLFAEVSAHPVQSEQFHKDFRKMIIDMTAALLAQIGILRHADPSILSKLKMFGLFLSASQYHPCVLVPVFDSEGEFDFHKLSFVLCIEESWLRDLLSVHPLPIPDLKNFSVDVSDLGISDSDLQNPSQQFCEKINDIASKNIVQRAVSRARVAVNTQQAADNLEYFFGFCQHVREFGLKLSADLDGFDQFDEPLPYPKGFPQPVQSRPSLSSSATETSQSRSGAANITLSTLPNGEVVVEKRKRNRRNDRPNEGALLTAAQGPGIVKLHGYHLTDSNNETVLIEEALESRLQLQHFSPRAVLVIAIRLLLDGIAALQTLMRSGIVHCDISPNNFLYSMGGQAWKLTDFGSAYFCPADGSIQTDCVYGTDGYIAPDALHNRTYSPASDAYGFGRTAGYYISVLRQHAEHCSFTDEVHGDLDMLESLVINDFIAKSVDWDSVFSYLPALKSMHDDIQEELTESESVRRRALDSVLPFPEPNNKSGPAESGQVLSMESGSNDLSTTTSD